MAVGCHHLCHSQSKNFLRSPLLTLRQPAVKQVILFYAAKVRTRQHVAILADISSPNGQPWSVSPTTNAVCATNLRNWSCTEGSARRRGAQMPIPVSTATFYPSLPVNRFLPTRTVNIAISPHKTCTRCLWLTQFRDSNKQYWLRSLSRQNCYCEVPLTYKYDVYTLLVYNKNSVFSHAFPTWLVVVCQTGNY